MRYMIVCVDGSTKTVSEDEGRQALMSWAAGSPIIVRGNGLAAHYISAIKPIKDWVDSQKADAAKHGKYFCAYGHRHEYDERCSCGAAIEPLLLPEERRFLSLPEPARRQPYPELPPSPEEREKAKAWRAMRGQILTKVAVPARPARRGPCPKCQDQGRYLFEGTWIDCEACRQS